jgi:NADPH:quinone reductase-like Zn-dependent oxidoreductase
VKRWVFPRFGNENLRLEEAVPESPGPGQVVVGLRAASLNYRDLLIVQGLYNPRLPLPQVPVSDGAGEVLAVAEGVTDFAPGDRVITHPVVGWEDGRFRRQYSRATLGGPGPGMGQEQVVLPEAALCHAPSGWSHEEAACLPIAALTAWSALVTEGPVQEGQTVLTLGTGGVSIFALQFAKALGARVIITSSSHEKLDRARSLGADVGIHRIEVEAWDKAVREATNGEGADLVVENGGAGTLGQSLRATAAGGTVAMLGALTGLEAPVQFAPAVMRRIRIAGVMTDCRRALRDLVGFLETSPIRPVIDSRFPLAELPEALDRMARGAHFGKIVIRIS